MFSNGFVFLLQIKHQYGQRLFLNFVNKIVNIFALFEKSEK